MQSTIVLVASLVLDVSLRIWLKDKETYVVNNVLDIERLAVKLGCDFWGKRQLSTNIEQCINSTSEKLYSAHLLDGIKEERKKEIVKLIVKDLEKVEILREEFLQKVMLSKDITPEIMKHSEKERLLWSEKEKGAYHNCVRFVADAIVKFTTGLPSFSTEALKILYRRNEEMWDKYEKRLDEICSLLKASDGTQVEFKEFQIDYLRKVASINSKVELFGSGISKRAIKYYDLSTSYIELWCEGINYEDIDCAIEISKVFDYGNIVWIGGEAGGGKTTFLQWLAISAATKNNEMESIKGLIPIVLKLREIDFPINYKKEIEKIINSSCPDGWIDYLFKYDKLLLLFDGLDEISEENRIKVYKEIERIYDIWKDEKKDKRSKIVVTSRMYVDDELQCEHCYFEIMRMKMPNIKKFVQYWHNTILKDISEKPEKINEYSQNVIDNIAKSQSLRGISSTPLLCAMICALGYTNDKIIPTNRLELYDKCCHMLVSERDVERHIKYDDRLDKLDYSKKERILEDIAYYMMNAEKAAMPKSDIVEHLKAFLKDSTLVEEKELREKPEILVDYLVRRTGIIREMSMGTIDFVHKTFLEYIASKAIIRKSEFNIIPSKSDRSFWKEAIVMCFGQLSRENASKQLKELLLLYENTKNIEYIFMASLCAKGTSDIEIAINEQIDELIETIIPPQKKYISKLSKTGDIIIPFLYDKENYSDKERIACLQLLDRLFDDTENEEIVPVVFSYVLGTGKEQVKNQAIRILSYCSTEWLDEHSIREKMSTWLLHELEVNRQFKITDDILSLILVEKIRGKLINLKEVVIVFTKDDEDDGIYGIDTDLYKELVNIKKITIENVSSSYQLEVLEAIEKLDEICINVCNDKDIILDKLMNYKSVKNIKALTYLSNDLSYICSNDLLKLPKLETVYLKLGSDNLEMQFSDWIFNNNVKQIHISVTRMGYMENEEEIRNLVSKSGIVDLSIIDKSHIKKQSSRI